jgi:hypothetical protein
MEQTLTHFDIFVPKFELKKKVEKRYFYILFNTVFFILNISKDNYINS